MNAHHFFVRARLPLLARPALALLAVALLALAALSALGSAQAALSSAQRGAQLNLSLVDDSDNIAAAGTTIAVAATISFTVDADVGSVDEGHGPFGAPIYLQSGGRFRVAGNLEWERPGRGVLQLNPRATSDADKDDASDDGRLSETDRFVQGGQYTTTNPARPDGDGQTYSHDGIDYTGPICVARTEQDLTTWTCAIAIQHGSTPLGTAVNRSGDHLIAIPDGQPDGPFTISANVQIADTAGAGGEGAVELNDSLTVNVGKVIEVQTAALDFATQTYDNLSPNGRAGDPWPNTVAATGSETRLQVSLLNSAGAASATGSVTLLHLFASTGRLSSVTLGPGACIGGDRQSTCQIDVSKLNSTNSDRIEIRVEPPLVQRAGSALIRGTLLTADGRSFSLGPVRVRFTGAPVALNIQEPGSNILNMQTPGDNRDQLTLAVTAVDSIGNPLIAPTDRARFTLTGPNGRNVASGVNVEWPLGGSESPTRNSAGHHQVRVNVTSPATDKLANGQYTLSLRAGGLTATQTFTVGGGPAKLTLSEPQGELAVGQQITFTATVLDADDNPVPNGTTIDFDETQIGATEVIVQLSADSATTNGKASATYLVLSAGRATLRVDAGGDAADLILIDIAAALAAAETEEPPSPADGLSNSGRPGFNAWSGEGSTSASALLDDLDDITGVLAWSSAGWLRFARSEDGRPIPGSFDFQIYNNTILWLSQ